MGGASFECVSAPATVTVEERFTIVVKTNLKSFLGHSVECFRRDIGEGFLRGEDYPPYDNGTFTFPGLYYKQRKPPNIPYGFPTTFGSEFVLYIQGTEVASLNVNVTVTG
ncbi:hypothetical protein CC79DRAFT_1337063 [Sarocladium strictum]